MKVDATIADAHGLVHALIGHNEWGYRHRCAVFVLGVLRAIETRGTNPVTCIRCAAAPRCSYEVLIDG